MQKNIIIRFILIVLITGTYLFSLRQKNPDVLPPSTATTFNSEKLGLGFKYSSRYFLKERDESNGQRSRYSLILTEDTEENRRVFSGQEVGRESPPTITIGIFQNNLDDYPVKRWVEETSFSNYKLAKTSSTETTLGGEPAVAYDATGLYENKNVVVARENFVYMFTVFYNAPTDQTIKDFDDLLRTVQFQNSPAVDRENLKNIIVVDNITEGQEISSPLVIRGKARGTWFFEASFPITITDWNGKIIAEHHAEAKSDWMTENFVPFEATVEFVPPAGNNLRGTLILQKDNPSGLPEHDAALEIPIAFKK
ncbi:MAG: Gmad2 immunoglobulin-like domain-containing protein [Patescibacteria group bacterium]